MKKIISVISIIFIILLIIVHCCGCATTNSVEAFDNSSMFIIVENNKPSADYFIVYHKQTKVMYAVSNGNYNRGNFTLLVNSDNTPMLYTGE